MKTPFAATAVIIASALIASSPAFAQLTREQVQAEFAAAVLSGDVETGQRSLKRNELNPGRYPARQVQSAITREQVKAELVEAVRTGDIAPGERSLKLNELYPSRYPAKQVRSSITREQVMAERESALRTGNYMANAETGGLCKDEHPSMHPAS